MNEIQILEEAIAILNRYKDHYECDDTFYSCPASDSAWESRSGECCCGADAVNAVLPELQALLVVKKTFTTE